MGSETGHASLHRIVARVVSSGPDRLTLEVPNWPGHRPGQFVMLTLDPEGRVLDPLLPRPLAIYRGQNERIDFRFKVVGRGTRLLGGLSAGASVGVVGPLGNGFHEPRGRPILVGGGTGIASLYELAVSCGPRARILLGGRTAGEILGLADFERLDAKIAVTTEDGSLGTRGRITDLLEPHADDEVFACGPKPMMREAFERAEKAGSHCSVSLESRMACGFGICLGCAVRTTHGFRYVCSDGPVFEGSDVDWDRLP